MVIGPYTVLLALTKVVTERTTDRTVAKDALIQHVTKLTELAHVETTMKAVVVIVAPKENTEWTLIV
jgi:hypothetical protein